MGPARALTASLQTNFVHIILQMRTFSWKRWGLNLGFSACYTLPLNAGPFCFTLNEAMSPFDPSTLNGSNSLGSLTGLCIFIDRDFHPREARD